MACRHHTVMVQALYNFEIAWHAGTMQSWCSQSIILRKNCMPTPCRHCAVIIQFSDSTTCRHHAVIAQSYNFQTAWHAGTMPSWRGHYILLTRSRRRVPPVARTRLSHRAACTTGGARLIVPLGGVYHRWLALGSHRAACRPMKRDVDLYAAAGWNKCKSAPAWTC